MEMPAGCFYQKMGSLIFLGHAYYHAGNFFKAEENYVKASLMTLSVRDPLICLQEFYYNTKRWHACIDAGLRALDIQKMITYWYEDAAYYKDRPHDFLGVAYFNIGDYKNSLKHVDLALSFNPDDARLKGNRDFIVNLLGKEHE